MPLIASSAAMFADCVAEPKAEATQSRWVSRSTRHGALASLPSLPGV